MRCHKLQVRRWFRLGVCLLSVCWMAACSKSKPGADPTATTPETATPAASIAADETPNLALRLKVGQKFPLQKTVVTTLVQPTEEGAQRSTAQKEFLLTITVEEMPETGELAGQKKMGVKFHSVRFSRELNGKKLEYDSRTAKEPIPLSIQPYHGLVGNSFSFWLGQDNQIEGIVAFDQFVERCLKGVPKERFEEVWNNLATQTGADGIANFVDDSIGLLPKARVDVGESWTVTRRTQQPIPMVSKNRYTLQQIDEKQAEVSILGEILPGAILPNAIPGAVQKSLNMSIVGGKATGSCTIDLRTGLPIHSQVEQFVDMRVKLRTGEEFVQHKQTITTIRAFPQMDGQRDTDKAGSRHEASRTDRSMPPVRVAQPGAAPGASRR